MAPLVLKILWRPGKGFFGFPFNSACYSYIWICLWKSDFEGTLNYSRLAMKEVLSLFSFQSGAKMTDWIQLVWIMRTTSVLAHDETQIWILFFRPTHFLLLHIAKCRFVFWSFVGNFFVHEVYAVKLHLFFIKKNDKFC